MKLNLKKILFTIILSIIVLPAFAFAETTNSDKIISETKYIRTVYTIDKMNNVIATKDFELTENEYLNDISTKEEIQYYNMQSRALAHDTHETAAKKLTLEVNQTSVSIGGLEVDVSCTWKRVPNVKHYDTIGFTTIGSTISFMPGWKDEFYVKQYYDNDVITYDINSQNLIREDNGLALVTNIVNSTSKSLKVEMHAKVYAHDITNLKINASYQHSVDTSLTWEKAKNITLGNSAPSGYKVLGGTFVVPNGIYNYYDQMAGVSVTYPGII